MNNAEQQHQVNRAQFNSIFGGRRKRREAYRKWLRVNNVPKPQFAKISQTKTFKALNAMTFLQDVMQAIKARQEAAIAAETSATKTDDLVVKSEDGDNGTSGAHA